MPLSIARFRTDSTFFARTIATLLCSVEMIGPARYSTPSLSASLGSSGARFRKSFRMVSLAVGHLSGGFDALMADCSTPTPPHRTGVGVQIPLFSVRGVQIAAWGRAAQREKLPIRMVQTA